jgi:hypothetical protein
MRRQDLTATSWFTSRAGAIFLAVVGLFFMFRPEWLGWALLARSVGGETALVSVGVGVAFLLCASLALEKDQLRAHAAEMMESLHSLLFGKSYKRDREAIEILLNTLESSDAAMSESAYAHLTRLTGQNFARDPSVWRSWWAAHQRTWSRSATPQDDPEEDVQTGGGA